MIDNFRHHSNDWSDVPRCEAPQANVYGTDIIKAWTVGRYGQQGVVREPRVEYVSVKPTISVGLTYVLWLLFGLLGAHYFYINKPGVGILYLLTGGLLGVGWVLDLFTLKGQVERANRRM